jgi:hypothetical protein
MTDIHELLSRAAAGHASAPPPFDSVLARARRRALRQAAATAGGLIVIAVIAVPASLAATHRARTSVASSGFAATSPTDGDSTQLPNLGVCRDVEVHATYPGGQAVFVPGNDAAITLNVGQSFVLTASGTCGVQYEPDNKYVALAPGESSPPTFLGGAPNSSITAAASQGGSAPLAPNSVTFTAIAAGTTSLPVQVDDHVSAADFDVAIRISLTVNHAG